VGSREQRSRGVFGPDFCTSGSPEANPKWKKVVVNLAGVAVVDAQNE